MTTTATLTIDDGFGTDVSLLRSVRGYPDGPDGVLNTLRVAIRNGMKTRPGEFNPREFRHSLWAQWSGAGIATTAITSPVDHEKTDAVFHYDVRPSRGLSSAVYVLVSALEEPRRGLGRRAMVPVHGFLVEETRVRALTERPLTQAQELFAIGRTIYAELAERVEAAVIANPKMLGEQRDFITAGQSCHALAGWLEAGERASAEAIRALEVRGDRALLRGTNELIRGRGRRDPSRGMVRTYNPTRG